MHRLIFAATCLLALAATIVTCAAFTPTTLEGAQCKAKCAQEMAGCRGSSYTCDRAARMCTTACEELDQLARAKK